MLGVHNSYLLHFIISLSMICASALMLGMFVYLRDSSLGVNRAFAVNALFVSCWSVFELIMIIPGDSARSIWAARLVQFFATFIPASLLLFSEELLSPSYTNARRKKFAIFIFIFSIPLSFLAFTDFFIEDPVLKFNDTIMFVRPGLWNPLFISFFVTVVGYAIGILWNGFYHASGRERKQFFWVACGVGIGYGCGTLNFLLTYDWNVFPLAPYCNYGVVAMYFIISLAMGRYRLMDIESVGRLAQKARLSALGTFIACVNHEVKNPLFLIQQSALTHLEKEGVPVKTFAEKTYTQSTRALNIISRLNGMLEPAHHSESIPVVLSECIEVALDTLKHIIEHKHIAVVRMYDKSAFLINADRGSLEEVLINLINNACQHMPDSGTLKVSIYMEGRSGIVEISDTGSGIAKKELDLIFEPFFTTRRESGGVGLGLYLARETLRRNHATISVLSKVGKGTTVRLCFPEAIQLT